MNFPYQNELRLLGQVRQPSHDDHDVVTRLPSFRAALRRAVALSGLDQGEIAHALDIDAGDFSRMIKEPRHAGARPRAFPADKLDAFARITGSLVVQQWLCAQVGTQPVVMHETRAQRLRRELAELEAQAA